MSKTLETCGVTKSVLDRLIPECPENLVFYDGKEKVLPIYGTAMINGEFTREYIRIPRGYDCHDAVDSLRNICTGVRFRFVTESENLAIICKTLPVSPNAFKSGIDCRVKYEDGYETIRHILRNGNCEYAGSVIDGENMVFDHKKSLFCAEKAALRPGKKYIEIMFPHFCHMDWIKVGLDEGVSISEWKYKIEKPVVYLGSSITQGIGSCRPYTTYEAQVSYMLDCNYINLGFSGSCRVQQPIIDYIKTLDMSAFIYDYDHNAYSVDFLRDTHEQAFKQIREAHPELPVIMMSKPDFRNYPDDAKRRRDVILTTYNNAIESGDKNVWFIDGESMFEKAGVDPLVCTFDGCHPNDLGYWCMASSVAPVLKSILYVD